MKKFTVRNVFKFSEVVEVEAETPEQAIELAKTAPGVHQDDQVLESSKILRDRYLTIVYRLPLDYNATELMNNEMISAASWSHAIDEKNEFKRQLDQYSS